MIPIREKGFGERLLETVFKLGLIALVLGIAVAGIPTWLYLGTKYALQPEGFWQNLLVLGVGVWFLGAFQVLLIFAFLWWTFQVITM